MDDAYLDFLRRKIKLAEPSGFDVAPEELNPAHTRDIVRWMLKGGRRACFARFGLHKTATQLEFLRLVGVRAIRLGRRAGGSELNAGYFADQVQYLQAAERDATMPSLFDVLAA